MFVIWGEIMQKHELLVPAGNMECLREAVYNGCDAVYLACKNFGARKFANNFDNDEILEAIKFCHLYGVKIYVTMNTLVKNAEVDAFIEQAEFLHKSGVDALIVQDFGMICLLREKYPNLEIHASTQANISSKDVCKLYYDLGVKRVVFSRELSIEEIDSIDVPIEKEAFIHGALCISYSGCCLMSSMLGGRSGNRGECAGCCRLPYTLEKDGKIISKDKYLLSTKELNTSRKIEKLLNSSIYSFKIEGRMKSPLYVGFITNFYRRLIDGENLDYESEINKLKTIFNREFTCGRIFNATDIDMMNVESPNHKGLLIGKVIDVTPKKIKIQLNNELHQYDAIRFSNSQKGFIINYLYDEKDNLINSSSNICYVDNNVDLSSKDDVYKTQDYLLSQEYNCDDSKRKIRINYDVCAKLGQELCIKISDGTFEFIECGNIVEKSINAPVTIENIKKQLGKLGDTPFVCEKYSINFDDNIFISLRELNEVRRKLVNDLISARQNRKVDYVKKEVNFSYASDTSKKQKFAFYVHNKKQLDLCKKVSGNIIVNNINLYNSVNNAYYAIPRETFNIKDSLVSKNYVSDYANYKGYDVIGNYSLNVMNIYTAYYLSSIGVDDLCLSVELSDDEVLEFIKLYENKFGYKRFYVLANGKIENMIIKGNILGLDENEKYNLIDSKDRKFSVYYDGINTHIYNYENHIVNLLELRKECNLLYDFIDMSEEQVKTILDDINDKIVG